MSEIPLPSSDPRLVPLDARGIDSKNCCIFSCHSISFFPYVDYFCCTHYGQLVSYVSVCRRLCELLLNCLFSSSELTGPFSVTLPCCEMILTL